MSFLTSFFGREEAKIATAAQEAPVQPTGSLEEEVKHQIETVEGELAEAKTQLAAATDPQVRESLQQLVVRKTQNVVDLREKLAALPK